MEQHDYYLDDVPAPGFALLPPEERAKLVETALEQLDAERQRLLAPVREMHASGAVPASSGEQPDGGALDG
jgi:hypothetical protein